MSDRKKAVLLAAALLIIAVLCCVRIYITGHDVPSGGQALYADLYQNGELLQTICLDTVTGEYTFEITGDAGATNTVCVRREASLLSPLPVRIRSACTRALSVLPSFPSPVCLTDW